MTQTYATHRVLPLPYIVCGAALLAYALFNVLLKKKKRG